VGAVRVRPRARLRAARSAPLSPCARRSRGRPAADGGARAIRLHGLQAGPGRDRSTAPANPNRRELTLSLSFRDSGNEWPSTGAPHYRLRSWCSSQGLPTVAVGGRSVAGHRDDPIAVRRAAAVGGSVGAFSRTPNTVLQAAGVGCRLAPVSKLSWCRLVFLVSPHAWWDV